MGKQPQWSTQWFGWVSAPRFCQQLGTTLRTSNLSNIWPLQFLRWGNYFHVLLLYVAIWLGLLFDLAVLHGCGVLRRISGVLWTSWLSALRARRLDRTVLLQHCRIANDVCSYQIPSAYVHAIQASLPKPLIAIQKLTLCILLGRHLSRRVTPSLPTIEPRPLVDTLSASLGEPGPPSSSRRYCCFWVQGARTAYRLAVGAGREAPGVVVRTTWDPVVLKTITLNSR